MKNEIMHFNQRVIKDLYVGQLSLFYTFINKLENFIFTIKINNL